MVAMKPHYFLDLGVQQTVENFLEYVAEFWSSNEFADSLEDHEILTIDTSFFVEFFVDLMYKEDAKDVWEVVKDFLTEESFSSLCHHLLIILEERDLCVSWNHSIRLSIRGQSRWILVTNARDFGVTSCLLEVVLSKCRDFVSIDQLILLNAVVRQGRQILRLLHEEGDEEERLKIKGTVAQICMYSNQPSSLVPLLKESFKEKAIESVKWLGLQSWALHYWLSEDCQTLESWESLFIDNAISFRKSGNYELLDRSGFSGEWEFDLDERASVRVKQKKKEKRRKMRRKNLDDGDCFDNELLDLDMSKNRLSLRSMADSWLLSSDRYSTSWSSVDLPEHVSKYCFSTWMEWIFARWRGKT